MVKELKERGHGVTITGTKPLKKVFEENNLNAKAIGYIFSFFKLFLEQFNLLRAVSLLNYMKDRKVDLAFSLGSRALLYSCLDIGLPVILFIDNPENMPTALYFEYDRCSVLISDSISEQTIIEKGVHPNKITTYKGDIKKETLKPDINVVKELITRIEVLSKHIPGGLQA